MRLVVLALALSLAPTRSPLRPHPPQLTLEIRVFDGAEEVTSEARFTVHRAGERSNPVAQSVLHRDHLEVHVPPGIYDVQAIREKEGQVVSIRWAERLVVMAYPDESGRHLEVVNFKSGFGALQIRTRGAAAIPDVALYASGARDKEAARRIEGAGYALFVVPAGRYDVRTRMNNRPAWHTDVDVPLDRTRLWHVK